MQRSVEWLWIVGFFGLLAVAEAQTPPPATAGTQFDGTYAFVSAAKVNETYTTSGARVGRCLDKIAGQLTIAKGHARYSGSGRQRTAKFEGTVGTQGELAMRSFAPGVGRPYEITVSGRIEGDGTVRARQIGYVCGYDLIWRKMSK